MKNRSDMEKVMERLEYLLNSPEVLSLPGLSFDRVCRMLGVSPVDLNEIIGDELGIDGEEMVECYRKSKT